VCTDALPFFFLHSRAVQVWHIQKIAAYFSDFLTSINVERRSDTHALLALLYFPHYKERKSNIFSKY
jgi:hypothetical protein